MEKHIILDIIFINIIEKHMNMAMKRILGVEKKNRIQVCVQIETEFIEEIKKNNMRLSDTVNVLLEKELYEKKRI